MVATVSILAIQHCAEIRRASNFDQLQNEWKSKTWKSNQFTTHIQQLPLLGVIENEFEAVTGAVVDFTGVILFVFIVDAYGV